LDLLSSSISVPPAVDAAATMKDYAVMRRYPGDFDEYQQAAQMAKGVVAWARIMVKGESG
jgi:hypothetical protein